jgi:hypothetical protein
MENIIEPATTTGLIVFGLQIMIFGVWMYLIFNRSMIGDK